MSMNSMVLSCKITHSSSSHRSTSKAPLTGKQPKVLWKYFTFYKSLCSYDNIVQTILVHADPQKHFFYCSMHAQPVGGGITQNQHHAFLYSQCKHTRWLRANAARKQTIICGRMFCQWSINKLSRVCSTNKGWPSAIVFVVVMLLDG